MSLILQMNAKRRKRYCVWGLNPRKISLSDLKSDPFDHSGNAVSGRQKSKLI